MNNLTRIVISLFYLAVNLKCMIVRLGLVCYSCNIFVCYTLGNRKIETIAVTTKGRIVSINTTISKKRKQLFIMNTTIIDI